MCYAAMVFSSHSPSFAVRCVLPSHSFSSFIHHPLPSPSLARPSAISFSRAETRFLIISASPHAFPLPRPLLITPSPRRPFSCLGCSQ